MTNSRERVEQKPHSITCVVLEATFLCGFCQETLSEALRLGQTGKPQKVPSWNKIEDKKVGNTRGGETVIATSMATAATAATASATPKTTGAVKVACRIVDAAAKTNSAALL